MATAPVCKRGCGSLYVWECDPRSREIVQAHSAEQQCGSISSRVANHRLGESQSKLRLRHC